MIPATVLVVPDHWVSQLFQTVPNWFSAAAATASKLPSTLIISSGATSVSNHSSLSGDILIIPTHWWDKNGVTFSTLDA